MYGPEETRHRVSNDGIMKGGMSGNVKHLGLCLNPRHAATMIHSWGAAQRLSDGSVRCGARWERVYLKAS